MKKFIRAIFNKDSEIGNSFLQMRKLQEIVQYMANWSFNLIILR